MNCKKVRRLLPLMIGSEIPDSKIIGIKAHLEECPDCRREYDAYKLSIEKTKEWLAGDRKDLEDWEWQRMVRHAAEEKAPKISPLVPWPFKKAWAYALMAVFLVVLTLFVVMPSFIKELAGPEKKMMAKQEVVSMTIVSKETGLKIVWFFNKNFELKEIEE